MLRWLMLALLLPTAALAQPAPHEADFTIPDFHFHTGQVMALKQHYTTLGDPKNPAVLVLHGTGGTGKGMLNPAFGGQLFGFGQPLDATRYFIILPDSIGAGGSSKPSDGMRMKFPAYDYADMAAAQYQLLTEGLHISHLKLVTGNSMGGMMTWLWGEAYPDFMDGLVPLASQPVAMASRNWMMRRLVIETIKADPAWNGGNYTAQPPSARYAGAFFSIGTSGGNQGWQARAGTHAAADKIVTDMLAAPDSGDANDSIYQLDASRDYDPEPGIGRIKAAVLAINSADDERNPPETGTTARVIAGLNRAQLYVIPASAETRGHGTTGQAHFWVAPFAAWLAKLN